MKNKEEIPECIVNCGVEYAFKRIGGKYKGRILWHLGLQKVLRYGELGRSLPDITTKMLTQTLRELEDDNLIIREMYHVVPPKVEYSLSSTGLGLMPFIEHLHDWGKAQLEQESLVKQKPVEA
jgi:DNA-binding HxlR family transcriptional regulator